ncbi:MAG: chorismate mutase [Methanosarcinaceae archaeon]|jgi:chorismate mutase|nr:chorismate mutase [Methanosarcinaceae archaeon]NKQ39240.1 chorismate mutase [Methanosarcinales archaeon]
MNKLEIVRKEIEQVDEKIISLIKERVGLSEKVLECKKEMNIPIKDDSREKEIIERVTNYAMEYNLDIGAVKNIFKLLIEMNIEHQKELRGESSLP